MKKLILLLTILALTLGLFATEVVIGDGTLTQRFPLGSFWGYERSAALYTATEIGAHNTRISAVSWFSSISTTAEVPTKIYLKTTGASTLTTDTWANMILGATLLYDQSFTGLAGNDWNLFTLTSTFDVDQGDNLMILVERNYGGSGASTPGGSSTGGAIYSTAVPGTHLTWNADQNPPTGTGSTSANRPNVTITYTTYAIDTPPNPAIVNNPADEAINVSTGTTLNWGSGGGAPTGYRMFLGTNNPPTNIVNNTDLGSVFSYTPASLTRGTTYYWQVVPYNANGSATGCPVWSFTTVPEGMAMIGDGAVTTLNLPINPYYGYNYSQTLYLQSEIELAGQRIEKLYYHWNGLNDGTNCKDWTIYMGHTAQSDFPTTSDWVPFGNLIQVFEGEVDLPATEGWIEITLTMPFAYNNTDNLVIAVHETTPGNAGSSTKFFGTATDDYRGLRLQSDSITHDPASPASGTRVAGIANIRLQFGEPPTSPVLSINPEEWDFGVQYANTVHSKQFSLTNTGAGTLNINSVSLTGTGFELAEAFTPAALILGESAFFTVNFLPTAAGVFTGNVVVNDDRAVSNIPLTGECFDPTVYTIPWVEGFEENNIDDAPVFGWMQEGLNGTNEWCANTSHSDYNRSPKTGDWNAYLRYGNTRWMFRAVELQAGVGYRAVVWARQNTATAANATLTVSYGIEASAAGMTETIVPETGLVDGDYQRLAGTFIPATSGIYYLGILGTQTSSPWYISIDDVGIELMGENDLAATTLTGNTSPSVGTTAQYTVSVFNNGTNPQSTYTVKLYDEDDVELATAAGTTTIAPGTTEEIILTWTPTAVGEINIYGKVILAGDINPINDTTPLLTVTVMEAGLLVVEIGNGTATNTDTGAPAPYGTWYRAFRQQLLYTADDFSAAGGIPGMINGLAFNVQSLGTCTPMTNYTIRLKETDQAAFSTTFETGDYTTVWQRPSFMPVNDWNVHTFDEPFFWDGSSNLIVEIVTDQLTGAYARNALVYYTSTTYNSSLRFQSDSANGSTGTTGSVTTNRSNIRLFMNVDGTGSLAGTVTSAGSPLADVLISLDDTNYHTVTSASGEYSFPYLLEDSYTLTAHKIGYEDYSAPFTIVEDEDTIVNISMTASASVNVTGNIVGSDNPTVGLSDGIINLTGVINYTANTNAAGQFVVENVLSGNTYNYAISRAGYQTDTGTIVVGSTDYAMGSITLNELTLPPSGITATVNDAETAVNLIWGSPGTPGNYHFFDFESDDGGWVSTSNWTGTTLPNYPDGDWEWDNNYDVVNYSSAGGSDPQVPPQAAHSGTGMIATNMYGPYANCAVSGERSYLRQTFDLSNFDSPVLSFWHHMDGYNTWDYGEIKVNGTVVWGTSAAAVFMPWQELIIDLSAYDSLTEAEISFEWVSTTVVNYAGWYIDDIYIGPADRSIYASSPANISGNFTFPDKPVAAQLAEEEARLNPVKHTADNSRQPAYNQIRQSVRSTSRLPLGYKVWRLETGQENSPDLWTSLTPAMITDTTFIDPAWASFPNGVYKWAVRTIYTNDVVSNPGFSNIIRKEPNDMSAISISGNTTPTVGTPSEYTVRIKNTGTGAQAAGAYTVKIMSGTTELVSVPGPAIAVAETIDFGVNWNPTQHGPIQIFAKVVLPGDTNATNDQTAAISLLVMPAGQFGYTVGIGDQLANIPVNVWYRSSLFQMIIYPAELGNFYGFLNGIQLYNNFVTDLPSIETKIWFETTTLDDLSAGWVPITAASTLTFDGPVHYPSGENTVSIPFAEPYMYMNGENLLITIQRPLEGSYHSSSDKFKVQTIGTNRAREAHSDSIEYDPTAPPTTGALSGQFPMTTLLGIPGGVGHLSGTVTTGTNNAPLEGVLVQIADAGYEATTNDDGEYEIQYILPQTYDVSFSRYGYITQTQELELDEDEEAVMNAHMDPMPTVSVSGSIVASDTGDGLAGAVVALAGYANYTESTNGDGEFTFAAVYADESYEYIISCPGYTSTTGIINVGSTAYAMGTITISEIAYAPTSVVAALNTTYTAVELQWGAPDPSSIEITESFEDPIFPPQDWSQVITNAGVPNSMGVYPTFKRVGAIEIAGETNATPTDGSFQTGLWWSYEHQDEWLITPAFNCPPDAYLRFDSYVFLGSVNDDHYYVKASIDGGNSWQILWDATAQTGGHTHYDAPFVVDLASYGGQQILLAFQAEDPPSNDGLWYTWFIDNLYIGNAIDMASFEGPAQMRHTPVLTSNLPAAEALTRDGRSLSNGRILNNSSKTTAKSDNRDSRVLMGYEIYRFVSGQEGNEANWTQLNDELVSTLTFDDEDWDTLPNSTYRWGVKAIYTADVSSPAALSNPLAKENVTGNIVGFIRKTNGQGIAGATVAAGTHEATTNAAGAYSLVLSVGSYSVTASAETYKTVTVDDVIVAPNQNTTLNITLEPAAGEDELSPVTATALKGNSPNPFNPSTTIYYDILEPCNVRLDIYNVKGQKVRSLLNEDKNNGRHTIVFEANDDNGRALSSGVYFYRFSAGKYNATRKMLLME